jgi:hypothetical protein
MLNSDGRTTIWSTTPSSLGWRRSRPRSARAHLPCQHASWTPGAVPADTRPRLPSAGTWSHWVDSSQELLNQARQRMPAAPAVRAKLETLALGGTFDAIVCRGVLNDICSDHGRTDVLRRFASHLSGGGLVVLDVRELGGTRRRYGGGRVSRRERSTPRGLLTFETVGRMDDALCGSRSSIISTPPPGSESLSVSSP